MKVDKSKILTCGIRVAQVVTGCAFLLSGLSKANDPLGMAILLQNYLGVMGIHTAPGAVSVTTLAILLATFEFVLGAYIIAGSSKRNTAYITLVTMLGFTALTAYIMVTDSISECGCFGSAIQLSNTQTFGKNLILLSLATLLCWKPAKMYSLHWASSRIWFTTVALLMSFGLGLWTWNRLPLIDFTAYRVGTNISEAMIYDFALMDEEGNDMTDALLASPDSVMLLTVPYEANANTGHSHKINDLWDAATDSHYRFYLVMAENAEAAERFKDRTGVPAPVLYASTEMLQTIVRANPGIVVIKDGTIINKNSLSNW